MEGQSRRFHRQARREHALLCRHERHSPEEAQRLLTLAKIEAINSQIPSEEVRGAVETYLKEQCI